MPRTAFFEFMSGHVVKFTGHKHFRYRLVLAILSGKVIRIDSIRSQDKNPGLRGQLFNEPFVVCSTYFAWRDYEVNFLRLLEKITNGSHFEISYTGKYQCPKYISLLKCPRNVNLG